MAELPQGLGLDLADALTGDVELLAHLLQRAGASVLNAEAQLEGILSSNENSFTAKTSLRTVEEEPELFPNHNPAPFSARKSEEPEQLIVSSEEEEYTPTLIERVTGFSIAKRNRKKLKEHEQKFQEPVSPSFAEDDYREEDKLNLEIPSFLRRK